MGWYLMQIAFDQSFSTAGHQVQVGWNHLGMAGFEAPEEMIRAGG